MAVFAVHRARPIGLPVPWNAYYPCSLDQKNCHRARVCGSCAEYFADNLSLDAKYAG